MRVSLHTDNKHVSWRQYNMSSWFCNPFSVNYILGEYCSSHVDMCKFLKINTNALLWLYSVCFLDHEYARSCCLQICRKSLYTDFTVRYHYELCALIFFQNYRERDSVVKRNKLTSKIFYWIFICTQQPMINYQIRRKIHMLRPFDANPVRVQQLSSLRYASSLVCIIINYSCHQLVIYLSIKSVQSERLE